MALTPRGEVSYDVAKRAVGPKASPDRGTERRQSRGWTIDQLFSMAQKTQQMLGQEQLQVVADMGYYNHEELKRCEDEGITAYVSKPLVSKNTARGLFGKEKFTYEADGDRYRCPAESDWSFVLRLRRAIKSLVITGPKTIVQAVLSKPSVPLTRGFTGLSAGSMRGFWDRIEQRVKANPVILGFLPKAACRASVWDDQALERPEAFLDERAGESRGQSLASSTLAYDIKRALNVVGVKDLIAALN